MKRFFVTILAVLYMAGAMGATVHVHYCMNELVGMALTHQDDDRCGKCGMKEDARKKGCCKDEHKTIKTAEHHAAKAIFGAQLFVAAIIPQRYLQPYYRQYIYCAPVNTQAQAHAPPSLWRTCPLYIEVCNFRI